MEFAVMTLLFWILMFTIVMVTLWVAKEVLYILCLVDSIKNKIKSKIGCETEESFFMINYPKLCYILYHCGYFENQD